MGEFDLIERFFRAPAAAYATQNPAAHAHIAHGIGDDCAVLRPTPGHELCVSTDLLIEGRHFLSTVNPHALGHKALAVNLSDLAACGARPIGFTLSLALPRVDEAWLHGFSQGMFALSRLHACPLVGGDTTAGPLTIGITVFGEVPSSTALLRSGARAGDELWVSGRLGEARAALEVFRGTVAMQTEAFEFCRERMERPTPRVALGQALRGVASACADISDGLVGDLGHILKASSRASAPLDAQIEVAAITPYLIATNSMNPVTKAQKDSKTSPKPPFLSPEQSLDWFLFGGDDYELVFTAPAAAHDAVLAASRASATPVSCIGALVPSHASAAAVRLRHADGTLTPAKGASFDHFA